MLRYNFYVGFAPCCLLRYFWWSKNHEIKQESRSYSMAYRNTLQTCEVVFVKMNNMCFL